MTATSLGKEATSSLQGLEHNGGFSAPVSHRSGLEQLISPGREPHSSPTVDVRALFLRVKTSAGSDHAAINALVEHYLPLVQYNAERVSRKLPEGVDIQDLTQAGYLGLRDAIIAFELDRGVKFETYCVSRIRGAMLDSLREMDWVPRLVRAGQSVISRATEELRMQLDRAPETWEVRDHIALRNPDRMSDDVRRMLDGNAPPSTISLDKKWYETDSYKDVREIDDIDDQKQQQPGREIESEDTRRALLRGFSRNERILYLMYVVEGIPMNEIGGHLGISESRVSQMFSNMIRQIRDRVEAAADSNSNNELSLIARNYNVAPREKQRNEPAAVAEYEISQRVMMRLEEMSSLSQVSFEWRKGRGELVSSEPDHAVDELIARAARQRQVAAGTSPKSAGELAAEEVESWVRESFPRAAGDAQSPAADADGDDNFGFTFIG